jgi:hypothetical protein
VSPRRYPVMDTGGVGDAVPLGVGDVVAGDGRGLDTVGDGDVREDDGVGLGERLRLRDVDGAGDGVKLGVGAGVGVAGVPAADPDPAETCGGRTSR